MAVRVTATGVKEIMYGCTIPDSTISAYIRTANIIVDKVFSGDTTISADTLVEIERHYTAHMVSSSIWRFASREKVGDAELEYVSKVEYVGEGYDRLASTPYGQTVLQLDHTGKMNSLGKRAAILHAIPNFED
jgi:hypothetical protein